MPRVSLERYARRWKTDGFIIDGDVVRTRERSQTAQERACDLAACDSWAMIPLVRPA